MRRTLPLLLLLSACDGGRSTAPGGSSDVRIPWEQAVPKALCGVDDRPETGLQGQVSLIDRTSGRSAAGYSCNLELVSQVQGEGAGWQFAWHVDCGYFGTANGDGQANPGVAVIDARDSSSPQLTAHLDSISMLDPWESLKANEQRQLLGAVNSAGGSGGPEIDLYDLSGDCAQPQLLASSAVSEVNISHAGEFAPDGRTYYGSEINVAIYPIDVSDPTTPRELLRWEGADGIGMAHDLSLSPDGMRAYIAQPDRSIPDEVEPNGLVILDVSDIQQRRENPDIRVVSTHFWEDGATAQETEPFRIGGVPHVLVTDEMGSAGLQGWQQACAEGRPPFGFARIFDVSDETSPRLVAKLWLEVHDPANCALAVNDVALGGVIFGYDSHYCTPDNPDETRLLACGYFQSGIRIFDIRDPYRPREIAYYNPPAQTERANDLPGSNHLGARTADWASSDPRFRLDRNEIWFTTQDNGFQIVRFTRPLDELLETP